MVDPPDIGPYSLTLHHRADELSRHSSVRHESPGHHFRSSAGSRKATIRLKSASALLVLLAAFCFLFTCVDSHVLPTRAYNDGLDTLHPNRFVSKAEADTTLLEGRIPVKRSHDQRAISGDKFYYDNAFSISAPAIWKRQASQPTGEVCPCNAEKSIPVGRKIAFAILVVILVLLSGVFAGLTLGYMSLDETQLQVLMTTGDEIQKARASKIMPIRKDGHLLLTTLLIANMITNEVS